MFKKQELVPLKYGGSRIKLAVEVALFAVSAIIYTALMGILGAMALLAFILIHEGGHVWAMEKVGVRLKGIYFLPLLGAAVIPEGNFRSYKAEFYTAIMGPTMDLTFALIALVSYWYTRSVVFPTIAAMFAFMDLLNLLPVLPLDGGLMFKSITFSLSPKIKLLLIALGFLAVLLVVTAIFVLPSAFILLLATVTGRIPDSCFSIGLALFAAFLIGWALLQSKALAQEEKMVKERMTKVETAVHSLLYTMLAGTLLLVITASLVLIIANPEGLLDFASLRIP